MKTTEELNALKEEVETVSRKLSALTEEELEQVSGGGWDYVDIKIVTCQYCGQTIQGTQSEIDEHIAACLSAKTD